MASEDGRSDTIFADPGEPREGAHAPTGGMLGAILFGCPGDCKLALAEKSPDDILAPKYWP